MHGERGVLGGLAERAGNGTEAPSKSCAACGRPNSIGVMKMPGAIAFTLTPIWASSRAIGRVIATTPPFEAEYAACPIWPSYAATEAVETMTPRSPSIG